MTDREQVEECVTRCHHCFRRGATVEGLDGEMYHDHCAHERGRRPYLAGQDRLLGAKLTAYDGGRVQVTPSLRHLSTRLGVLQLADRMAEMGEDYETLHPELS